MPHIRTPYHCACIVCKFCAGMRWNLDIITTKGPQPRHTVTAIPLDVLAQLRAFLSLQGESNRGRRASAPMENQHHSRALDTRKQAQERAYPRQPKLTQASDHSNYKEKEIKVVQNLARGLDQKTNKSTVTK